MKTMRLIFLPSILLFSAALNTDAWCTPPGVIPYYSIRSQAVDAARDLVDQTYHGNLFCSDSFYGSLSATTQYTRSFNPKAIAQSLFGNDLRCGNDCAAGTIEVSGSRTADRGPHDWLADYFYLPTDFKSTLQFTPRIENVVIDLHFYCGLDAWANGLFFSMHAPITRTRWDLNFNETNIITGTNNHDEGYFTVAPFPRANLLNNFSEFACGKAPAYFVDTVDFHTPNVSVRQEPKDITFDGLSYAKFDCQARTLTRLAALTCIIGYNFVSREDFHIGLGLRAVAPTGNAPTGALLFQPIVGNGGHWELGAQLTSHALMWQSTDHNASLDFYCNANITHLFKASQTRTFDLNNKPLSRYMLAEKMGILSDQPSIKYIPGESAGGGILAGQVGLLHKPNAQFINEYSPVANLTAQNLLVSINVQTDIAAQLTYTQGYLQWDLGYNFWSRSCEKLYHKVCKPYPSSCDARCKPIGLATFDGDTITGYTEPILTRDKAVDPFISRPNAVGPTGNVWALKGDAYVFGFADVSTCSPERPTSVSPLSATESKATINSGTNIPPTGLVEPSPADLTNPNVDGPLFAFDEFCLQPVRLTTNPSSPQTRTSIQPILIDDADFDYIHTHGSSHKIYTNASYNGINHGNWTPYSGIGGYAEFGNNNACRTRNSATPCKKSCLTCALSQWSVWIKFGVSFN
ncbi:MAG: hypothetical protein NTX86_02420 [Candidatus Dependentiae bacterium]|nr:hypothetical protein [Candidatus Dependentiae bacterium]